MKSEVDFGLNNFGKPKELSEADSIARLIMNILLMRPGQLPSMPHIGINIRKYLYKFDEDIDTDALKREISFQCSELIPFIDTSNMKLLVIDYRGEGLLMLIMPLYINGKQQDMLMGFKKGATSDDIQFNYQFEDKLI
jgi:hypothetical protein